MSDTGSIVAMGTFATVVNMYGAVRKNRNAITVLMASFIVTFILLVMGETKASRIAVAFAFAFMVTSLTVNASDLFAFVNTTLQNSARLKNQQNVKNNAYAHVDSWDRANINNKYGNADSWNR